MCTDHLTENIFLRNRIHTIKNVFIFGQFRCASSKSREAYFIGTVSEFAMTQVENGQNKTVLQNRKRDPCVGPRFVCAVCES